MRRCLVSLAASCFLACGGEAKPADVEASSGGETEARAKAPERRVLPEPMEATFYLTLRVPAELLAEVIGAQLPAHEAEGPTELTRPGKSPEIKASYELWRDPVAVSFGAGPALRVGVPLRYAVRFDARLKNPLGGGWLTVARNEPWGSARDPQRVSLELHTRVEVTEHWKLRLRTKVDEPRHGPPPDGKLCTGGAFKLCVTKASLAPEVRKRLDSEILRRLKRAATDLDRDVPARLRLRDRLEQAWRSLGRPRRVPGEDYFVRIEPRAAALDLEARGDTLVVTPAVWARVSYHEREPEPVEVPPLPRMSPAAELPNPRLELPASVTALELGGLLEALQAMSRENAG